MYVSVFIDKIFLHFKRPLIKQSRIFLDYLGHTVNNFRGCQRSALFLECQLSSNPRNSAGQNGTKFITPKSENSHTSGQDISNPSTPLSAAFSKYYKFSPIFSINFVSFSLSNNHQRQTGYLCWCNFQMKPFQPNLSCVKLLLFSLLQLTFNCLFRVRMIRNINIEKVIEVLKLTFVRSCHTFKLLESTQQLRMLTEHVQSICIQGDKCPLWKRSNKLGEKIDQKLISPQTWSNYPAIDFVPKLPQIVQPLPMKLLNILLRKFLLKFIARAEDRMYDNLRRIRFNRSSSRTSTKNMSKISPSFQSSHGRIERCPCVLIAPTNDSNTPVVPFRCVLKKGRKDLAQFWYFL